MRSSRRAFIRILVWACPQVSLAAAAAVAVIAALKLNLNCPMAGQYSESSRLSFPWGLFGGCFNHLFVARRLPRWVLVFAMDSTRFEVLETILKRSSNDFQMPAYWFLQWILQVLTCSQRSSNGLQTILKCPCIGFCNGFYKF